MRFATDLLLVTLALTSLAAAAPAQLDVRNQQRDKHPAHPSHPDHPHHQSPPPPPPPHPHLAGHPKAHPHPASPHPQPEPPHPHPHPHPQPPHPHPKPGPHPGPTTTTPTTTSTSPTSIASTSTTSTPTSQPTLPSTGSLSYLNPTTGQQGDVYFGEVNIGDDAAQLGTFVDPPEIFGIDSGGHLYTANARTLYTDGVLVRTFGPDANLPSDAVPYICVKNTASTPAQVLLDCTATATTRGDVNSFVLCDTQDVEASEDACEGTVVLHFLQFTLTPPPPVVGALSYSGADRQSQYLGEVAQNDATFSLNVVEDHQDWSLDSNGHLISPSGRALYSQGGSIYTFEASSAPADAAIYQCTQEVELDDHSTVLDCTANDSSELSICNNGAVYANDTTCAAMGGQVVAESRHFELIHGVQK